MKTLCLALLFVPYAAHAVDLFELERLERSCRLQQESLLKERQGTPACQEWKQAKRTYQRQQRLAKTEQQKQQTAQRRAEQAARKRQARPQALPNGQGSGYRWNGNENRYCQHNAQAIPTECY